MVWSNNSISRVEPTKRTLKSRGVSKSRKASNTRDTSNKIETMPVES